MADLVYKLDEKPRSTGDWLLYSFQWLITMFYAVVWGYAIVGVGLEMKGEQLTSYMSAVVLTIGVSTLLQAWIGHGFAMVSGPNVIPSLAIVAAFTAGGKEYALQAFFAQAIAGVIIAIISLLNIIKYIRNFWSPLILGSMIIMVGLAVAGTGVEYMVQGQWDWTTAAAFLLALGGTYLAIKGKGIWGTLPPLFVIGFGFLLFIALGEVDFTQVKEAPLFTAPAILPYGWSLPPIDLIIIMIVVTLMSGLNFYGNLHGYATVISQEVEVKQEKRSFTIFGLVENIIPGILGTPATVAYGENLGIVKLTKVAARAFIIVAAILMIVLSFFGPFGALMAAIPKPIAGAVLLGIASSVIGIGAKTLQTAPQFGNREQTLVGFSVFLSLGLYLLPPEVWKEAPRLLETIFGNPIISVILFVIVFEQLIFRVKQDDKGKEDREDPQY